MATLSTDPRLLASSARRASLSRLMPPALTANSRAGQISARSISPTVCPYSRPRDAGRQRHRQRTHAGAVMPDPEYVDGVALLREGPGTVKLTRRS